jgi:hypothetical protein
MNRRRFFQATSLGGLAVMAPFLTRNAKADAATYGGPYFLMVNASGGWDPTYCCDPKGGSGDPKDTMSVNRGYTPDQILSAGSIQYAPTNFVQTYGDKGASMVEVYSNDRFFQTYGGQMFVLNGLDTTTNNHDTGSRTIWSGQQADGFPSLAALIAGAKSAASPVPMAFLSNGGYDATDGVVALTRAGNIDILQQLAYPDARDPKNADMTRYVSQDTSARIAAAQAARLQAMMVKSSVPRRRVSQGSLFMSRSADTGLNLLSAALKSQPAVDVGTFDPSLEPVKGNLNDLQDLMEQAQLALLSFSVGVAVSANLNIGGYDTHSDHDNRQIPQIMKMLRGLDYIVQEANNLGIAGNLYVIVGSDFGRTPYYNAGNGKDHWNITSMMFSGPGIPGGRVYGASTPYGDPGGPQKQITVNSDGTPGGSIALQTPMVHMALRKLAGIDTSSVLAPYGLPGDAVPIFG